MYSGVGVLIFAVFDAMAVESPRDPEQKLSRSYVLPGRYQSQEMSAEERTPAIN